MKNSKTFKLEVSIFNHSNGQIAITHKGTNGKGFITTVNDKEDSARCHVNLFNHINEPFA